MEDPEFNNKKISFRRSDLALVLVGLLSSIGVYFGHGWYHGEFLPGFGIDAPLGDAIGGMAIILAALICQRLASLAIFRDLDFGLQRPVQELQEANAGLRREVGDLEHLATTDRLTGCWNRRHLEAVIPGEMARLNRFEHALSLLVVDIDNFKAINDTHGHQAGDRVLAELASHLQSCLRASDFLVRWGGEEFIVLSPHTALAAAMLVAERIRALVAAQTFGEVGKVTVSIGAAECLQGENWHHRFERADKALYRAKANGRNQIQVAPETIIPEEIALPPPDHLVQLRWQEAYRCGDPVIDREHQVLFALANELLNSIVSRKPASESRDLIELLVAKVKTHFQSEETILTKGNYPDLDQHIQTHRHLLARAQSLLAAYRAGALELGQLFQFLVEDVIARHLLGADRDFFPYVNAGDMAGIPSPGETEIA